MARRLSWILAAVGIIATGIAIMANPTDARASADQNWSPFVLVAGLLLIGLVADDDGLFAAAGHQLARTLATASCSSSAPSSPSVSPPRC